MKVGAARINGGWFHWGRHLKCVMAVEDGFVCVCRLCVFVYVCSDHKILFFSKCPNYVTKRSDGQGGRMSLRGVRPHTHIHTFSPQLTHDKFPKLIFQFPGSNTSQWKEDKIICYHLYKQLWVNNLWIYPCFSHTVVGGATICIVLKG